MLVKIEHTRDFRALAKLNETVQSWHHNNFPQEFKPFDLNEITNAFKRMLENGNTIAYLAKDENKPIGYLLGFIKDRPDSAFQYKKSVLYIDQIVVTQEYQNSGVGQLLMDRAYEIAKVKQVTEVQLDFWSGNQSAEHFFLRNGFDYFNHRMKK
ncbi:MAG: hypothetical protein CL843_15990 [Crocinitomicaceae bacterium]|nr:hypothetical protein [Crocinitomicaceae bacterium]|tara:strand:- start:7541 stop:8002 length:462 start_codon:yes stop_codon:yes gene_type:complete